MENTPSTPSPFAASPPGASAPQPPPASPLAAPPGGAPAAGNTSFLDEVPSTEPLIKSCTVPGVLVGLDAKESATGNPFLSVAVQIYGDKMVNEQGDSVGMGKRLTTTIFASSKNEEGIKRTGRVLKNTLLALYNVPLNGQGDAHPDVVFKGWPADRKPALQSGPNGSGVFDLAPFRPADKWIGTKVMVEVRTGKDSDGNRRNEFNLLAAATQPTRAKGK